MSLLRVKLSPCTVGSPYRYLPFIGSDIAERGSTSYATNAILSTGPKIYIVYLLGFF